MAKQHAYPLSALFISVAVAAALLAMLSPLGTQLIDATSVLTAAVVGGGLGGVIGFIVGMHGHRRLSRGVSGMIYGSLFGMTIGPITLVNQSGIGTVYAIQFSGSLALLVVGTIIWAAAPDPLWSPNQEAADHPLAERVVAGQDRRARQK